MAISEWISEWFSRRGQRLQPDEILRSHKDYIDSGILDSIAMIEFIMDIESRFHLRLTTAVMKDPRFSTLSGLVELLDEAAPERI